MNKPSRVCTIDGEDFSVGLVSITRKVTILDKFAERTMDGDLKREIIGSYFNYELTFAEFENMLEYKKLFDVLTAPQEFHTIIIPKNIGYTEEFKGYVAEVEDKFEFVLDENLRRISGLKCSIISKTPTLRPHGR
jgi:hypothetical protein